MNRLVVTSLSLWSPSNTLDSLLGSLGWLLELPLFFISQNLRFYGDDPREIEECLGKRLRELCILVSLIDGLLGCQHVICCSGSAHFKIDQTYLHTIRVRYLIYSNWVEPPEVGGPIIFGPSPCNLSTDSFSCWLINTNNTASPCRGQDIH